MSGSKAVERTANTAKAESSPEPSYQADPEKETELKANTATANDIRAYLQIMHHSAVNAREAGAMVKIWQSQNGQTPVAVFAVYQAHVCPKCENVYPDGENCGICAEVAP